MTPTRDSATSPTPLPLRPVGTRSLSTRFLQALVVAVLVLPALATAYLSTAPTADRNWFWQNQLPQGNDLRGMSWVDTQTAWAVGVAGTAMKTTDGGKTWTVQDPGTTSDLTGVSIAPTSTTGWIVGLAGTIRKTTNGGTNWTSQSAPSVTNLRAVSSWSTTVAVAVGDTGSSTSTICYTSDGATWRSASTTCTVGLSSVEMVSATTGWAVGGNGEVLKTVNGGASWTWSQPTTSTAGFQSVSFAPGGTVGYIVGNSASPNWTIFKTTNSGATWAPVNGIGVSGAVNLFGVDTLDATNTIVIGANGQIRRTKDAGVTWINESQNNVGSVALRAVKIFSGTNAYAIGDTGMMFYTVSSGTAYPSWFTLLMGAQAQWNCVDFFGVNNGWAVGNNGAIMRTTDAGATWQNQAGGTNAWLGVASVSTTEAWAVGQNGWIAHTVNGSDWTTQTSGTTQQLNGVWFTTALNGVAVGNGGTVLRTANGGTTWTVRTSGTTQNLNAVWFAANGTLGYAVGNAGTIIASTNSGNTWAARAFAVTTQDLMAVGGDTAANNTLNQTDLWVGGVGTFRFSTSGGQNAAAWTDLTASVGLPTTSTVRTVSTVSTSTVWVTGDYGLAKSTPNGTLASPVWTTQNDAVPQTALDPLTHIWSASLVDANTCYLSGDSGVVRRTVNGGVTWTSLQYGTMGALNDIKFTDSSNGWAVGAAGTVLRTSDGGQTWAQQKPGTTAGLWGISMPTSSTGWAVGDNGAVRYTVNGGVQWTGQTPTTTTVNLNAVAAGDATHAVIAGQGLVNYTVNGSTWTSASVPPTNPVTGLSMVGTASVWAVTTRPSGNNAVWHSVDGGKTWASQATTANAQLWDVWFRDANNGYAVGDTGIVLRTVNGGTTWIKQPTPTSSALNTIRFSDANNGWAAGANGVVISSADGGSTWALRQSGTNQTLNTLAFAATARAFIVGNAGLLLRNENIVPPTSSLAIAPPGATGSNGWYAPTAPALTISSSGTGTIKFYSWTSAAGPFTTYSAPFPAIEGNQTLYFYSSDASSNAGPIGSQGIKSDFTSPTAPPTTGISLIGTSSVTVTWTAAADAGSGVDHYDLFINGAFNTSTTALSAQMNGLTPNTLYTTITVQAVDQAGLRSSQSTPTLSVLTHSAATAPYVTVLVSNPATPNGAAAWYVTTPTVTLSSTPVDAQSRQTWYSWNVAGANVSGNGNPGAPWTAYSVPLTPPNPGSNILYFWTQDTAGGRAPEIVRTQAYQVDTAKPATPTVTAAAVDYRSITASWTPVPEPPSSIDHYDVYLNGSLATSVTTSAVDFTGLTQQTTYTVAVRAVSSAGTTSGLSATQTVTTPVPPLPFAPAYVYAKAPNGATVYLDWAAADNVAGTVSYHVWRSSTDTATPSFSIVATVTGGVRVCSYIDSGVRSSYRYWYAVSTIDPRGESSMSVATTYTGVVTLRPQRPVGLTATGLTPSSILLQWEPSGDQALLGYYVYRADSSMAATATTLTAIPWTPTAFFDLTAVEGQPYWYTVKAVDASSVVSYASIEAQGHSTLSPVNGVVSPHEAGPNNANCLCHATHDASGYDKLTRFPGSGSQTLCQPTCHAPSHAAQQFVDPLLKSKHPEGAVITPQEPYSCITCHVPLFQAGGSANNLMRTNSVSACSVVTNTPAGDGFCYSCHGPGSSLIQGDLSGFEDSSHASVPAPATGANIKCDACHESHSSRNDFLLRYSGMMICMQCHTVSPTNPSTVDIYDALTINDSANAAHPLLPEDQANGARMSCQNCHNTHSANSTYPLVDPHNPSPAGKWLQPQTDEIGFCVRCHDGNALPTSVETTPWAGPVLASAGATTAPNIQLFYSTNYHGYAQQSDSSTTTAFLRTDMGYKYGDVLQCRVCHDPHGTANTFGVKDTITSASGDKTISGVLTVPMAAKSQRDFRFFCSTCHIFDPAVHDLAHPGSNTSTYPCDCRNCHRHSKPGF